LEEAVSQVRASRARVGGFQGCSVDNKLVAEIGERHLVSPGSLLLADRCFGSTVTSEARRRRARAGVPLP